MLGFLLGKSWTAVWETAGLASEFTAKNLIKGEQNYLKPEKNELVLGQLEAKVTAEL